jgi:hypothetical protein
VTSTLIVYEDAYHEQVHGLVKALRRDLGRTGSILEGEPGRGTGQFENMLGPLLRKPLKQTRARPDRVICVADADRPANLAGPSAPPRPSSASSDALTRWVLDLEGAWKARLVVAARLVAEEQERVEVVCLRWSKESLLVACPDALLEYAAHRAEEVRAVMAGCRPDPMDVDDPDFVALYQSPGACMDAVLRAMSGEQRKYKKGRDDEDILRDAIRPHRDRRDQVLARCPDLKRLVDRIL